MVLSTLMLFALAPVAFAQEPAEESKLQPDILIETADQLVLSFSGEVADKEAAVPLLEQAADAIKARSVFGTLPPLSVDQSNGEEGERGSFQLHDDEEKDFGDGYTSTAFTTYVVSGYTTTDVDCATAAVWYGTEPQVDCDLITTTINVILNAGFWYRVPSGWTNDALRAQGYYEVEDAWYLTSCQKQTACCRVQAAPQRGWN